MSKQSYTSGPWEQRNNKVFSGGKCICSNVNAASPTTQSIAEDVAMSIANAKLIAAAPELLEALQVCIEQITALCSADDVPDQARAAIAKATA
ncbi:TPA: hypothetical protein ONB34_000726 [Pseudomonas aeruginosa]|uniref:hypothetical protein n=1 Tax=Pseudomonas aeruginosa TaxID=287 RepID=UPI000F62782B|nr:hypothetical protein [Pseudomonas aeruginosa]RRI98723.1 hypothetical protein EIM06_06250 [Pseudomonas aeruginosa]HBO3869444.1 hypothetical protein [Pseudomonas aeruginosa]HCF6615904.1 hypothetical protein [Pseudomonas aeruginosa]HCL4191467.1 hypothetical protein [Pseudomonas aeruginosa]HCR1463615.1 hypothetical protein [Pseudomonas aeruginosa]